MIKMMCGKRISSVIVEWVRAGKAYFRQWVLRVVLLHKDTHLPDHQRSS
jgi:hypothetical protein